MRSRPTTSTRTRWPSAVEVWCNGRRDRLGDCARGADAFMTSVPGPPQVEAVMAGPEGALAVMGPGSVWVDLTTNDRELVRVLASDAPDGVAVVDSPVTGAVGRGPSGDAHPVRGRRPESRWPGCGLCWSTSGRSLSADRYPVPATWSSWSPTSCGSRPPPRWARGSQWALANGVELRTLWEAVLDSVGDSFVARHDAPSIFAGHYDPSFPLSLCVKDLGLLAGSGVERRRRICRSRQRPADAFRAGRCPVRPGAPERCASLGGSRTTPACRCAWTATGLRTGRSEPGLG